MERLPPGFKVGRRLSYWRSGEYDKYWPMFWWHITSCKFCVSEAW